MTNILLALFAIYDSNLSQADDRYKIIFQPLLLRQTTLFVTNLNHHQIEPKLFVFGKQAEFSLIRGTYLVLEKLYSIRK